MSLTLAGPVSGVFFSGNDHAWDFTVTIDGVAVDIGSMTCKFVMKRPGFPDSVLSTEDTVPTAVATIGSPSTNGVFTITVENAATIDLLGTYQYQAQVENGAGEKSNILHGYFTFKENIIS